ncbi:uncharacterized protein TM35_000061870 [Trypanosoma theileri]|uniref:Secreted protein n=1 Tax=Trypanosoma theileri TaxID=67003 RepID=A0A1X0P2P1_9TRYP|nr:uncharacterized protein TM35_000061870 [Trypanosoma theileri]ORC91182.1 hypothetical protein TM35_000061870 [Trypanosoma theileri]
MFAVHLLDALAEAAVLLIFDMAPTCTSSDDDDDVRLTSACITSVNSANSLDSLVLRGCVNLNRSDTASNNNNSLSPPPTSSMDESSFVHMTMEELQTMSFDPVHTSRGRSGGTARRNSSCSTLSSWTAAGEMSRV